MTGQQKARRQKLMWALFHRSQWLPFGAMRGNSVTGTGTEASPTARLKLRLAQRGRTGLGHFLPLEPWDWDSFLRLSLSSDPKSSFSNSFASFLKKDMMAVGVAITLGETVGGEGSKSPSAFPCPGRLSYDGELTSPRPCGWLTTSGPFPITPQRDPAWERKGGLVTPTMQQW